MEKKRTKFQEESFGLGFVIEQAKNLHYFVCCCRCCYCCVVAVDVDVVAVVNVDVNVVVGVDVVFFVDVVEL